MKISSLRIVRSFKPSIHFFFLPIKSASNSNLLYCLNFTTVKSQTKGKITNQQPYMKIGRTKTGHLLLLPINSFNFNHNLILPEEEEATSQIILPRTYS